MRTRSRSGVAADLFPRFEGAVAVWSPGLNPAGTSHASALALEALVERTGWSVFRPDQP
jgi:glutaminase